MGGGKFCRYRPNELGDDLQTRRKEEGVSELGAVRSRRENAQRRGGPSLSNGRERERVRQEVERERGRARMKDERSGRHEEGS